MYYLTGGMQLSGSPFAQVGLSWGDNNTTLPTSGTKEVLEITDTGNSGEEGLWVWRVDTIPTLPGTCTSNHNLDRCSLQFRASFITRNAPQFNYACTLVKSFPRMGTDVV